MYLEEACESLKGIQSLFIKLCQIFTLKFNVSKEITYLDENDKTIACEVK